MPFNLKIPFLRIYPAAILVYMLKKKKCCNVTLIYCYHIRKWKNKKRKKERKWDHLGYHVDHGMWGAMTEAGKSIRR